MTRPVIAVLGPPRAGVTSLAAALRGSMPDVVVVEGAVGDVTVLACSAVAPMAESDRQLSVRATGPVLGVLTKIDAHRTWREVLAANRSSTVDRDRDWVAVAAAPDLGGAPDLGDLVARVRALLADGPPAPVRTARPADVGARVAAQRSRLRLMQWTRQHCADTVTRWRGEAARVGRGDVATFEARVRAQADALLADVGAAVDREIGARPGSDVPAPARIPTPMHASRRTENQLAVVLGIGFGLGVAFAAGRVVTGLLGGSGATGVTVGLLAGVAVTVWVVVVRSVLQVRAVLDRWVAEVGVAVRAQADGVVAARLLTADATTSATRRPLPPSNPFSESFL